MDMTVELTGVAELISELRIVARNSVDASTRALNRIGLLAQREAKKNAPRSPTQKQKTNLRKTRRKVKRNARAVSRAKPGGLERSIEMKSNGEEAQIFVAVNSEAGRYARKMHEGKNKPGGWRRRGIGTIAKGGHADEKFIERAIYDNEGKFVDIIRSERRKEGL